MIILILTSIGILGCLYYLYTNLIEYYITPKIKTSKNILPDLIPEYSEDVYFLFDFKDITKTFNYSFISDMYHYDLSNRSTELSHIHSNLKLNKNLFIEALFQKRGKYQHNPSKYLTIEDLLTSSSLKTLREFNESLNYLLAKKTNTSKEYLEDLCYNYFYNLLKSIYKHNVDFVDLPVRYKPESLRVFHKLELKFIQECSEILKGLQKLILEDLHYNTNSRFESLTSEPHFKSIDKSIEYILNQKDNFNNLELKVVAKNLKDSTLPALKLHSLNLSLSSEDRILLDSNLDIIKNIISTDHTTTSIKNDLLITERYLKSLTVK